MRMALECKIGELYSATSQIRIAPDFNLKFFSVFLIAWCAITIWLVLRNSCMLCKLRLITLLTSKLKIWASLISSE